MAGSLLCKATETRRPLVSGTSSVSSEEGDIGRNRFADKMQAEERYDSIPQFYTRATPGSQAFATGTQPRLRLRLTSPPSAGIAHSEASTMDRREARDSAERSAPVGAAR